MRDLEQRYLKNLNEIWTNKATVVNTQEKSIAVR